MYPSASQILYVPRWRMANLYTKWNKNAIMLGLCSLSLSYFSSYVYISIYTHAISIELITKLSQRKRVEPHLKINKLRTKRWDRQAFQRKWWKEYNAKGIIILWWTIQPNLSCIYDSRKSDLTYFSKKQRREHLKAERNRYCQIEKYGII